jgi:hypothetical protein
MEAMERQFNAFKDKMESDMRQATDQKESIQQLQGRGGLWRWSPYMRVTNGL